MAYQRHQLHKLTGEEYWEALYEVEQNERYDNYYEESDDDE